MGITEGSGHQDNKRGGWLLVLGMGILVLIIIFASGCGKPTSGKIIDKFQEPGSTEIKCTGTGVKKKCKLDTDPPVCRFYLRNTQDEGWFAVDCADDWARYEVGQQYP